MASPPVHTGHDTLKTGVAILRSAGDTGTTDDGFSVLTVAEGIRRELAVVIIETTARLQRRGAFTERGYRSPAGALTDLLGSDRCDTRLQVLASDQVCTRIGLNGEPLPPRLPKTAELFTQCRIGLRHIEAIAHVLGSKAAGRLAPQVWELAEAELATLALERTAPELYRDGTRLVDDLDQDGAEPDHDDPPATNELRLIPNRNAPGGTLRGRFDSAELFAAIAVAVDAKAAPLTADDQRSTVTRQAEALADICAHVLDEGAVPETGGQRPQLTVLIRLEDLERRARTAMLDLGATITPNALRMLACDAGVIPMVLNGKGEPLNVGRMSRTATLPIRRAVAARDRGCARPGCNRPPSWCHVHHVLAWENGGATDLNNCVMLCRTHHREAHMGGWEIRIIDGIPEFIPPAWIDPERRPRRKPPLYTTAA